MLELLSGRRNSGKKIKIRKGEEVNGFSKRKETRTNYKV